MFIHDKTLIFCWKIDRRRVVVGFFNEKFWTFKVFSTSIQTKINFGRSWKNERNFLNLKMYEKAQSRFQFKIKKFKENPKKTIIHILKNIVLLDWKIWQPFNNRGVSQKKEKKALTKSNKRIISNRFQENRLVVII